MARVFNFSAGPGNLPLSVLERAQAEFLDWNGLGASVLEVSHRSADFIDAAERAETALRRLMGIPEHYKVLFLQGGATLQFSMLPMNLLGRKTSVDLVDTGHWSRKAKEHMARYAEINVAATAAGDNYTSIPVTDEWDLDAAAAYVHYTPNETIGGVEFHWIPDVGDVPLVADMSSTILSRPIDVSKFGVIYAGAQKNIGPAGLTVIIVREDLLGNAAPMTPPLFDYQKQVQSASMLNTAPTFSWYMAGLVFDWLENLGGLDAMAVINQRKSEKLYRTIDQSEGFYVNSVQKNCRSWMNVPFRLHDKQLDQLFLQQSKDAGLVSLKGHRVLGGIRASIYNAMPEQGVDALTEFMQYFSDHNG